MPYDRIKRLLLGEPLSSHLAGHERIPKWKALSTLSSDALSSVAYATDAILPVLGALSVAAMVWSIPIAFAITVLLAILTMSYRQTIDAYPSGGGAYTVARENLGITPGLTAAASLAIDYILTVSVSVASGVDNLSSAFPVLLEYRVIFGIAVILMITVLNLRGIRESATVFSIPTYFFVFSILSLIVVGFWRVWTGTVTETAPLLTEVYPVVPIVLVFRAFAEGCSALTGVEAISNGITVFEHPTQRNAKTTMLWMSVILGVLFLGVTSLTHVYHIVPHANQTVLSLLGRAVFGKTAFYYLTQIGTALILFLAANTSYADFPRLASLLARDRYLPRQLASVGDRLVFSNGILGLSTAACLILIIFKGETLKLIPLYAIGVFISFTLSQSGMIIHHLKEKSKNWKRSLTFNAIGVAATFLVLIDIAFTKFLEGAWIIAILIPMLVLIFRKIHQHYVIVGLNLSLTDMPAPFKFEPVKHMVVIPVSGVHRGTIEALRYAQSIAEDIRACYVEIDPDTTERVRVEWNKWYPHVPMIVLKSPYRSLIQPIIQYIDEVSNSCTNEMVTVVVPEFVTAKRWHQFLHNQSALLLRTALSFRKGHVVTRVRYHLRET